MKPKNTTGTYRGIYYDSHEELAMLQWLFELKDSDYIRDLRRAPSFLLSDALVNSYVIPLKTKSKNGTQTLLQPHSYTAEFLVCWNYKKARDKIIWTLGVDTNRFDKHLIAQKKDDTWCSYIECKPSYDFNNMTRTFILNRKWMWQKYGIFVNLVKKDSLFEKTFTPAEYLKTATGKQRKIKWKPRSLKHFLDHR